jgi:hypothetical protein
MCQYATHEVEPRLAAAVEGLQPGLHIEDREKILATINKESSLPFCARYHPQNSLQCGMNESLSPYDVKVTDEIKQLITIMGQNAELYHSSRWTDWKREVDPYLDRFLF